MVCGAHLNCATVTIYVANYCTEKLHEMENERVFTVYDRSPRLGKTQNIYEKLIHEICDYDLLVLIYYIHDYELQKSYLSLYTY